MRLVDSSAWVEWLMDTKLGVKLGGQFPPREEWVVPTIVQYEVFKWLAREVSEEDARKFLSFTQLCNVLPLDTVVAVRAAELSQKHRLATADAIIYATAIGAEADLLTCDQHFEGLASVIYLAKEA